MHIIIIGTKRLLNIVCHRNTAGNQEMMLRTSIFIMFALLFCSSLPQKTQVGWKGIVPLHSTRKNVEQLLGPSSDKCRCLYQTPEEMIYVEYAKSRCNGSIPGWDVAVDTVLSLTVRSNIQLEFKTLNLDLKRYEVREDDTFTKYFSNRDDGIEYAVTPEGKISSIKYTPNTKDNQLRCAGFPLHDGSFTGYTPFDQYSNLDFNSEIARLDNFAVMLGRDETLKGYIVVYAGKIACLHEATYRGNRARAYLINNRTIAPTRITVIDGGYRQRSQVELYGLPQNAAPPIAFPTISSNQAKIVKNNRCR
jgi:hypothetical protein